MVAMTLRLPLRVGLGVGLVAGCVLALQVLLTRLFSAALFYHFSFLSISLALLGAGAGAIAVYMRPRWFERRPLEQELAFWSAVFAALLLAVPLVLARIRYGTSDQVTWRFAGLLALTSLLTILPFAAGGTVIALAVRGYTATMSRLYAFDLAGAALGAVVMVPLMWEIDVPTLVVALAPVAALAAVVFAAGMRGALGRAAVALLVLGLAAVVLADSTSLYEPEPAAQPGAVVSDRWTPISRVVGYAPGPGGAFTSLNYDRGGAPVARYDRGGPLPEWRDLGLGPHSLGYVFGGRERALIIGGGGGRDILNALSEGVRRVDVVELNRAIRDTVDDSLGDFSGAPYSLPRVHTRIGDGRSRLAEGDERYDVIHIGYADTFSNSSGQAFALAENNLYTVEAFEEYFDHLRPDGVLDVTRPHRMVGDEALRITMLALEALRRRGVERPERHVVVVLGQDILSPLSGTTLARTRPWTEAELARLRTVARERGKGVAFAPGGPYRLEWAELARASSPREFCSGYRLDVCAPTDDRPFFFQMRRLGALGTHGPGYLYDAADPFLVLLITFGILTVLSLALVAAPLVLTARRERPPLSALGFFAAIGLGFLTLEIALIQRFVLFLGFPTYALSVVLFSLLLWTGLGSLLAGRVRDARRALTVSLVVAGVLIAASAFGLLPLLAALIDLPFAARVAITVALLAPAGVPLGMAMPLGLNRLAALYPRGVAWAWGVNGVASVVASAGAITVAIMAGFPAATLVALACYLGALAHVVLGAWPERATAEQRRRLRAPESHPLPDPAES
jgi:Spermine/spermidine synthase domain